MTMLGIVVWYLVALTSTSSQVTYTGPYPYDACMTMADNLIRNGAVYAYCTPETKQ